MMSRSTDCHILMFPWFAVGHMTPFLHLANKLAEKGCSTTILLPEKGKQLIQHFNLHPHLITFHTLDIPHVEGLPAGTQTASEIPFELNHLLAIALDRTRDQVNKVIGDSKPDLVMYDFAHWVPQLTRPFGIKTIKYVVVSAAGIAIALVPARNVSKDKPMTEDELSLPPDGYPSSAVMLRGHEVRSLLFVSQPFGDHGITFYEKTTTAMKECDAIAIRTCYEVEGKLCDYIGSQYAKSVFLTGPVLPELPKTQLEDRWDKWLGGFEPGSVVFCAFGSQLVLEKKQFQELVLGFELTGLPFLLALKPPTGSSTIEEALPQGFEERVKGRGVWGEWVQQLMILNHPSVGCFVSHCGFGSMWESLMADCQIVLVPHLVDHILNTRLLADELKVAVEVERDENGWVSKENISKSIQLVMDKNNEIGSTIKLNHYQCRERLTSQGVMEAYIDKFVKDVKELVRK